MKKFYEIHYFEYEDGFESDAESKAESKVIFILVGMLHRKIVFFSENYTPYSEFVGKKN